MSEIRSSSGLCRCCHAKGDFTSLGVSEGAAESFAAILRGTFEVIITPMDGEIDINTYSICPLCIARLRDAANFKRQVVACEKKFICSVIGKKSAESFKANVMVEIETDVKEEYIFLDVELPQCPEERICYDSVPLESTTHNKEKEKLSCEICAEAFRNDRLLQLHLKKHTCENNDTSKNINKSHKVNGKYVCTICSKNYDKINVFKTHLKSHSDKHTSPTPDDMGTGQANDEGSGKIFKCDYCDKEFQRKKSIIKHLKLHTVERNFVCGVCDKSFLQKQKLKRHMLIHTKECSNACRLCRRGFPDQKKLKRHYIHVHSGEKPLFSCSTCEKQFSSQQYLNDHETKHTGPRLYTCDLCEKNFKNAEKLKSHMKVHTGEKPYKCSYCGKQFAHLAGFRSHERRHKGEKPYVCKVCTKGFVNSSSLDVHMKVHTGEKPYSCDICAKSFAQKGGLSVHVMRKHLGEKFSCKICDKKISNVHKHMRAKHPEERFRERVASINKS
ncbi:hypothetical protein ABMA27_011178 [Loxostege sticticalis]|uniref:C2H2-type domain-containing protein n=1 Tax=Loxostege sticticalis TaxID=481309 RepID=A0ABR3H1L0_LOXSC